MLHTTVAPSLTLELPKAISAPMAESGFYLEGETALALTLGHLRFRDQQYDCPTV